MKYQEFIRDRSQSLMNAFAMAEQAGEIDERDSVRERIVTFNEK